jgi:hypothetical protein
LKVNPILFGRGNELMNHEPVKVSAFSFIRGQRQTFPFPCPADRQKIGVPFRLLGGNIW